MKPAAVLELAEQLGVFFRISSAGKIKAKGGQEQINRLAPIIQEHKAQLLEHLQKEKRQQDTQSPPYLDNLGRLRIPLDTADKYQWWAGGQSVFKTLLELGASEQEIEVHIGPIETPDDWKKWQKIKKRG